MPKAARSSPRPEEAVSRLQQKVRPRSGPIGNQRPPTSTGRPDMVSGSNLPVRTIIYIEVGNMPTAEVRAAVAQVSKLYATNRHPIFICPMRNGVLTTDVLFEEEVLNFVRSICEVVTGSDGSNTITLRGGVQAVDVARLDA